MRAKMNGEAGQSLRDAKREFQRWRQGCRRPGRIPTELSLLAAEAAAELGIKPTPSQLQLSAEWLDQWVEQPCAFGNDAKLLAYQQTAA